MFFIFGLTPAPLPRRGVGLAYTLYLLSALNLQLLISILPNFVNSYSLAIKNINGVTNRMCVLDVSTPPIKGRTIGFITSLPTPVDHNTGISPKSATHTVMIFGRKRFAAPLMTNSLNSSRENVSLELPRS
jgi:hypothetical protein